MMSDKSNPLLTMSREERLKKLRLVFMEQVEDKLCEIKALIDELEELRECLTQIS